MKARWRPGRLTNFDQRLLVWCTVGFSIVRANDYLFGDDKPRTIPGHEPPPNSLTVLENALPLPLWGALLLVGALLLGLGMALRIHLSVWLGHATLAVVGSAIAISSLLTAFASTDLDGIRGFGPIAIISLFHWIMWARTGPRPLLDGEAVVIEQTGNRDD